MCVCACQRRLGKAGERRKEIFLSICSIHNFLAPNPTYWASSSGLRTHSLTLTSPHSRTWRRPKKRRIDFLLGSKSEVVFSFTPFEFINHGFPARRWRLTTTNTNWETSRRRLLSANCGVSNRHRHKMRTLELLCSFGCSYSCTSISLCTDLQRIYAKINVGMKSICFSLLFSLVHCETSL